MTINYIDEEKRNPMFC